MAVRALLNITASAPTSVVRQLSPWHSPVPYLFGGLAAMLCLIAFALLILACSYWKLSGNLENGNEGDERDLEAGEGQNKNGARQKQHTGVFDEKILVIMAGEVKPTFLATRMSSRWPSFGDSTIKSCSCSTKSDQSDNDNGVSVETVKQGRVDQGQSRTAEMTTNESDQTH